jgi:hypothetical protein
MDVVVGREGQARYFPPPQILEKIKWKLKGGGVKQGTIPNIIIKIKVF